MGKGKQEHRDAMLSFEYSEHDNHYSEVTFRREFQVSNNS